MADTHSGEEWRDYGSFVRLSELRSAIDSARDDASQKDLNAFLRAYVVFAAAMFEEEIDSLLGERSSPSMGDLHWRAAKWRKECEDRGIPVGSPGEDRPNHDVWLSGLTYLRHAILHPEPPSSQRMECIEQANLPTDIENLSWDLVEEVEFRYAAIGPTLYWIADDPGDRDG